VVNRRRDGRISLPLLGALRVAGLMEGVVVGKQKNSLRKPGDTMMVV
jgi:protein involved in polysaccharide export with SLBB domain